MNCSIIKVSYVVICSVLVVKISDKSTFYSLAWEDPKQFLDIVLWTMKEKDSQYFECRICKSGSLKLSNMRPAAVRSHMKPSKAGIQKTKHE